MRIARYQHPASTFGSEERVTQTIIKIGNYTEEDSANNPSFSETGSGSYDTGSGCSDIDSGTVFVIPKIDYWSILVATENDIVSSVIYRCRATTVNDSAFSDTTVLVEAFSGISIGNHSILQD